jgi:hypothetical protein
MISFPLILAATLAIPARTDFLWHEDGVREWARAIFRNEIIRRDVNFDHQPIRVERRAGVWEARTDLKDEGSDLFTTAFFVYIDPKTGKTPYFTESIQATTESIKTLFTSSSFQEKYFLIGDQKPKVVNEETAVRLFKASLLQWLSAERIAQIGPYTATKTVNSWKVSATRSKWNTPGDAPQIQLDLATAEVNHFRL